MVEMSVPQLTKSPPVGDPRRRWAVDVGIALAITAAQLGASYASMSWHHTGLAGPRWLAYLLLSVSGLALIARRRFPVAVLAVSLGATIWAGALSGAAMIWLGLIAAFVNAVIARKRAAAVASLLIGYVASFWPLWRIGRPGHASVALAVGVAAWLLVLLAAAEVVRMRRQRTAEVTRSREEQLARQAGEERMRIARDLHDVVAHNISVINVQANTALHLMDRQPDRAREALTAIHDVSKQALAELRSVLGVLRADGDAAPRAPSPGLGQLDDLLSAVGGAGLGVRLSVHGDERSLPAEADLASYRIIQEALTNAARHSASRVAEVVVLFEPAGVRVQVDDPGPAHDAAGPSGPPGNGIAGMTERARALGGTLSAGRRPGGGFRVLAWLPSQAGPGGSGPAPDRDDLPAVNGRTA